MKTTYSRPVIVTIALLVFCVFATACSGPSPEQILSRASENMLAIKTANISVEEVITVQDQMVSIKINGSLEMPDKGLVTMNTAGQSFQMLILGEDETYFRENENSDWQYIDIQKNLNTLGLDMDFFSQKQVWNSYSNPEIINEETVDDNPCYHLSYTVDFSEVMSQLLENMDSEGIRIRIDDTTANGEFWIGKTDYLIHKGYLKVVPNLMVENPNTGVFHKMEMLIITNIRYSKFNEPVELPEPSTKN